MPIITKDRIIQVVLSLDHDQLVLLERFLDQLEVLPSSPKSVSTQDQKALSRD